MKPIYQLQIMFAILVAALTLVGIALIKMGGTLTTEYAGWISVTLAGTIVAISFRRVQFDSQAAVSILDFFVGNVGSGTYFLPKGLVQVWTVTLKEIQEEFPDDPENIVSEKDDPVLTKGKSRPFRPSTASFDTLSKEMKSRFENPETAADNPLNSYIGGFDTRGSFAYRITRPGRFIRRAGGVDAVRKSARDMFSRIVKEAFQIRTPALILADIACINCELIEEYKNKSLEWGIEIVEERCGITDTDLSHGLNVALRDLITHKVSAQAAEAEGEADRILLEKRGLGEAAAMKSKGAAAASAARDLALAEAEGAAAKLKAAGDSPLGEAVIMGETAEQVMAAAAKGGNLILVDGTNIHGVLASLMTSGSRAKSAATSK